MENEHTTTQGLERAVSWAEIREAIKGWDPRLRYYGVPRGGQYIAAMLNPVDTPEQADVICDDLVDSGTTRQRWAALYPHKPFLAAFDKIQNPGMGWLRFPWEQTGGIEVEENVLRILQYFDDPTREGLRDTPRRYIKFLTEFLSPPDFVFTTFDAEQTDEMVVQKNIPFYSLCEHHIAPFFGVAHVAYIPGDKIVGLSKLARTVDLYARRFQNQERITTQIAERLMHEIQPRGVAVVLRAQHLCMSMRGVMKHDTWTVTSKLVGRFKEDASCRSEFLEFIK